MKNELRQEQEILKSKVSDLAKAVIAHFGGPYQCKKLTGESSQIKFQRVVNDDESLKIDTIFETMELVEEFLPKMFFEEYLEEYKKKLLEKNSP